MNVNIDKAERYMRSIGKVDGLIRRYSEMAGEQRETVVSVSSPTLDPQKTSGGQPNPDKIGKAIARLEELENILLGYVADLAEKKAEALKVIWKMENYDHQNLIVARYLQMKSPEQICAEFDKEERWFYRHRLVALEEFGRLL